MTWEHSASPDRKLTESLLEMSRVAELGSALTSVYTVLTFSCCPNAIKAFQSSASSLRIPFSILRLSLPSTLSERCIETFLSLAIPSLRNSDSPALMQKCNASIQSSTPIQPYEQTKIVTPRGLCSVRPASRPQSSISSHILNNGGASTLTAGGGRLVRHPCRWRLGRYVLVVKHASKVPQAVQILGRQESVGRKLRLM